MAGIVSGQNAIHQLLAAAGNTLLHGLLEPEGVQAPFEILNTRISLRPTTLLTGA